MPTLHVIRRLVMICSLIVLAASAPMDAGAQTPDPAIVRRGDAVVTGFAGTVPPGPDLPADVHPLDRTTIDLDGVTVRIFDLTQLGGGPAGQLSDAPVRFVAKARDVGHVFGVAFDGDGKSGPPNIYLTATSAHGLQLVAPGPDGRPQRVMTGRPGAQWMPGLFGADRGGGPGSIWKIDGRTGVVSLFADIRTGDLENSGAGLGSVAFDARSRHLYVSDLETGLIWRLDLEGRLIDVYDHGTQGRSAAGLPLVAYDPASRTDRSDETFNTEMPETWGFAAPERRVWGVGIESNRLYYSVADGPQVWSVGLDEDGRFGVDPRRELDIVGTPAGNAISAIQFDGADIMYLAQRGSQLGSYDYATFMRPQEAMAMRYAWNAAERRWIPKPEEYAIGMAPEHQGTLGGLALNYGYDRFGNVDYGRCRQTLWSTGEHLRAGSDIQRVTTGGPRHVHGLQGIYKNRVRPANEPPFEAWFIDYDANFAETEAYGHVGNVAIFGPCAASVTYSAERVEIPVWTRGPNLVVEKRCHPAGLGGRVRCVIVVRNTGDAAADGVVQIVDQTVTLWGPGAGALIPVASATPDGDGWTCGTQPNGAYHCRIDGSLLGPGAGRGLVVWIDTGPLVLGGNLGFRNCVTLDHPAGKGRACAEGGTGITVAKTGPDQCLPGDDCKFQITLTNRSESPFSGEVALADTLFVKGVSVDAPITSIQPPLGCTDEPTDLPFACQALVSLAPGESRTHTITIEMPGPGPLWAQNCFAVADPWWLGDKVAFAGLLLPVKFKGNAQPGGQPSCTWVKLDAQKPAPAPAKKLSYAPALVSTLAPPLGLLPPGSYCADGRSPLANGRCPCPISAPWDPDSGTCRWQPVCWDKARLTPDGGCCSRGTVWWPQTRSCRTPPVVGCTDVWRRQPDGGCCPSGTRFRDGSCRPPVISQPCAPGYTRLLAGTCIKLPILPPVVALPTCGDGRARLPNGRCPPLACPQNAPFNAKSGRCERLVDGVDCRPGTQRLGGSGACVPVGACPGKFIRDGSGKCLPPILTGAGGGGTGPLACGPGQSRINGQCVGSKPPALPTNVGVPPVVKTPVGTVPPPAVPPVVKVPPKEAVPGRETPQVNPVIKDVKPIVKDTKPVVIEPKPAVKDTKPAVKETKPVVRETKPVVKETKPVVRETKPVVTETKPNRIVVKPVEKKPVPKVERKPPPQKAQPERAKGGLPSRPGGKPPG